MAKTQRFGFHFFGGDTEGALSDDGAQFTNRDRQTIDRLLASFETHDHAGGDRLADPTAGPTLTLFPEGGGLDADTTFFYRVSYVDKYGLETAASDEASVTTGSAVPAPPPPRVEAIAGGTLDDGIYWIAATQLKGGKETTLGEPSLITISDLKTIHITFPEGLDPAADQVSIWRQGPLDGGFTRLATLDAVTFVSYDDDGSIPADDCACDPSHLPPQNNETGSTARVQVDVPAVDIAVPTDVQRWRIYRTTISGNYDNASLVAEVADTTTEGGDELVGEFIDDGLTSLLLGQPLGTSQTLAPSVEIEGGGGGAGGQFFLADSNGVVWRLWVDLDGAITTSQLEVAPADASTAAILTASDASLHRLTVGIDGVLETGVPLGGERTFAFNEGPHLPSPDGATTFQLGVDPDGTLVTVGDLVDRVLHLPTRDEPAVPTTGGVMWVGADGALRFKGQAGTVTLIAPA